MGRPDLLLTDWDMPGIDGPELCRILRNDPVLAKVPIILASSLSLPPMEGWMKSCSETSHTRLNAAGPVSDANVR
ncbi:UNVERIFIED_ORG: CheY-like chemotaxis protein [Burkholderia sp. 1595]|uniref:CheY-like chemotaxis protein n=1 Tax=Paraburkholderia terricola TaxID=169427 RepID=A0ABU1M012_9BURK|nr:CheY-like chemotaxis protein [Paraburkholderia terricola]